MERKLQIYRLATLGFRPLLLETRTWNVGIHVGHTACCKLFWKTKCNIQWSQCTLKNTEWWLDTCGHRKLFRTAQWKSRATSRQLMIDCEHWRRLSSEFRKLPKWFQLVYTVCTMSMWKKKIRNRLPQIIRLAPFLFFSILYLFGAPTRKYVNFLQTLVCSPIHTLLLPAPSCRTHSPSPLSSWSWSWTRCQRGRSAMVSVPLRMVDAQLRTMMSPLSTRCPPRLVWWATFSSSFLPFKTCSILSSLTSRNEEISVFVGPMGQWPKCSWGHGEALEWFSGNKVWGRGWVCSNMWKYF